MASSKRSYLTTVFKGMAMGAADVVPGVSGGTIAFITGIYEELITTIDDLDLGIISVWKSQGFMTMFIKYNLGFLLSLIAGIAVSIISLAKLISHLLETHPIFVWSFFFGLVLASILYIGKQIVKWNLAVAIALVIGAIAAYYITIAVPSEAPDVWYYFFLSGFIAIIAMILPGVSGSFILVLLGSYGMVIGTITQFIDGVLALDMDVIKKTLWKMILFGLGCAIGLKVFSKALKWMFMHKKQLTLAVLTGFMIGSLNKIWPWKQVLSTRIDRHGDEILLMEKSILPHHFEGDAFLGYAILFAIFGFALILILERVAQYKKANAN